MAGPGLYGKLPARGDFLSRRLPRAFVSAWDGWLQDGMAQSREALGTGWSGAYLTAPLWRFGLAPGLCGGEAVVGVLMASVDRVGREFPLTAAAPVGGDCAALLPLADPAWFAAVEDTLLTAFDRPFDLEAFDARIARTGPPGWPPVAGDPPAVRGVAGGLRLEPARPAAEAAMWPALAHGALAAAYGPYSLWATTGSPTRGAACLVFAGLPPAAAFAGLLDGRFAGTAGACGGAP